MQILHRNWGKIIKQSNNVHSDTENTSFYNSQNDQGKKVFT